MSDFDRMSIVDNASAMGMEDSTYNPNTNSKTETEGERMGNKDSNIELTSWSHQVSIDGGEGDNYYQGVEEIWNNRQESEQLFFKDGVRRIDFVLAWNEKIKDSNNESEPSEKKLWRAGFEMRLQEEAELELEYDISEERQEQYVKIHAPWSCLTFYADLMNLRMPLKVSETVTMNSNWGLPDRLTPYFSQELPPMPKRYSHSYEHSYEKQEQLFDIPPQKDNFFTNAQRSAIVDYILRRMRYSDDDSNAFGIKQLLRRNAYVAAYPLHEGDSKPHWDGNNSRNRRSLLNENWVYWKRWYKLQPIDYVREYFGEKIGLYFAWVGFYTYFLIPASAVGVLVFIIGLGGINRNTVGRESCDLGKDDYIMCPKCNECPYWNYSSTVCNYVKTVYLFDNGATVFFAIFMSLWGTLFLEFWKREEENLKFRWNMTNFQEEDEPPRPEFFQKLADSPHKKKDPVTDRYEPYMPFWRKRIPKMIASFSAVLFLCLVAVAVAVGVIAYRMTVLALLYEQDDEFAYTYASTITSATAATINVCIIVALNYVYEYLAVILTDWECLRTESEYDRSLTFKLYTLQFVNYYSSIFYIAFFKGRFTGRPGDYDLWLGKRQEECHGGGCLVELVIQLATIFVGKQLIQNAILPFVLPIAMRWATWFYDWIKGKSLKEIRRDRVTRWEKDFYLEPLGERGLLNEYVQMLIQFGFVTIFVAAFPLAPLFALIVNLRELRTDARRFIKIIQRPVAQRAESIGVWYNILYAVSRIAILTNACVIAFTSSFINRLVYKIIYSPDYSLKGYVNNTLSYFDTADFTSEFHPLVKNDQDVKLCRYRDYRYPPWAEERYDYTKQYWHVTAAQFIFVVLFENIIILITTAVANFFDYMPQRLTDLQKRETFLVQKLKTDIESKYFDRRERKSVRRRQGSTIVHDSTTGSTEETVHGTGDGPQIQKTFTNEAMHYSIDNGKTS